MTSSRPAQSTGRHERQAGACPDCMLLLAAPAGPARCLASPHGVPPRWHDATPPPHPLLPPRRFPGLKEGDGWCLCASRWAEAVQVGGHPPWTPWSCMVPLVLLHPPSADSPPPTLVALSLSFSRLPATHPAGCCSRLYCMCTACRTATFHLSMAAAAPRLPPIPPAGRRGTTRCAGGHT